MPFTFIEWAQRAHAEVCAALPEMKYRRALESDADTALVRRVAWECNGRSVVADYHRTYVRLLCSTATRDDARFEDQIPLDDGGARRAGAIAAAYLSLDASHVDT